MNFNPPIFYLFFMLLHLTHSQGLCPSVYSSWSFDYKDTPMPVIMKFQKFRTSAHLYQCAHVWLIDCECFTIEKRYIASPNVKISNPNSPEEGWAAIWKYPEAGATSSNSNVQALKWKDTEYCQDRDIKQKYSAFATKIDLFDSYRFVSAKQLHLAVTQKSPRSSTKLVAKLLRQKYSQMKITWADSELGPVRRSFDVVLNLPIALGSRN